jgi:hypothetical protein
MVHITQDTNQTFHTYMHITQPGIEVYSGGNIAIRILNFLNQVRSGIFKNCQTNK